MNHTSVCTSPKMWEVWAPPDEGNAQGLGLRAGARWAGGFGICDLGFRIKVQGSGSFVYWVQVLFGGDGLEEFHAH